ncbi:hypothetical protein XAC3810_530162 [Xanthomonas citri pv. citri]|nr:hypothetical protein XAC9322_530162 [Xanthomonas citri pv. citri]CEE32470.1 hypothetical protein XAC3824_670162 [Xanthomonas citri pv. citri]CEE33853.1 hypothetical protein XAC1083_530138 [Xanthomonas citri pv. citri]CEE43219.1 hypothetical protein XAC3810_530162 [Xanthomonas citri pv. citri]CEE44946.1 hypothetical protein XAC902_700013 [Xanthomonas citri pv. citri]
MMRTELNRNAINHRRAWAPVSQGTDSVPAAH